MTRFLALPTALAGLMLAACGHSHPHIHSASGVMVPMPTRTVSFANTGALGDTQTYMPGDSCAGRNAHSSGALVGNAAGGTRYECSGFKTAALTNTAPATITRTYTAAPATRTYTSPSVTTRTYTQPTTTHTYTTRPSSGYTYPAVPQSTYRTYEQRQTGTVYTPPQQSHSTYSYSHPAPGTSHQTQTYRYIPGVPTTRTYTIPTEPDLKGN